MAIYLHPPPKLFLWPHLFHSRRVGTRQSLTVKRLPFLVALSRKPSLYVAIHHVVPLARVTRHLQRGASTGNPRFPSRSLKSVLDLAESRVRMC